MKKLFPLFVIVVLIMSGFGAIALPICNKEINLSKPKCNSSNGLG